VIVRVNQDGTRIAIATGASVPLPWFVFDINTGGGYSDGTYEKVSEWKEVEL
jgi:hypothetical protein